VYHKSPPKERRLCDLSVCYQPYFIRKKTKLGSAGKNGSEVARSKWPKLEVRWNESGDWVLGKASPIPTSYGIWGAL